MPTDLAELLSLLEQPLDQPARLAAAKEVCRRVWDGGRPAEETVEKLKAAYRSETDVEVATWLLKTINGLKAAQLLGSVPIGLKPRLSTEEQTRIIKALDSLTTAVHDAEGRSVLVFDQEYELLELIGSGGMGEVFKARSRQEDRLVAIKFVRPEFAASANILARFNQEYELLKNCDHPHIIKILDKGVRKNHPFIVMEYLAGGGLDAVAGRELLGFKLVLPWFLQVCEALEYIHDQGIIHRDLKPANILLAGDAPDSPVKLTDFGLAKVSTRSKTTRRGIKMGTPAFTAPEQWESPSAASPQSDIYSAGVSLYYLLSLGALPVDDYKPLDQINPSVPPSLQEVVEGCLARRPSERWPSAAALEKRLAALKG